MPLDYCHPTAPHEKLKLPVVSLQPNDGPCARRYLPARQKIGPQARHSYLADYSLDGKTIYIDRHMPPSFKYRGRTVDTDRFLILHEEVEKTLIDRLGLHYLHAHRSQPKAEEAAVRASQEKSSSRARKTRNLPTCDFTSAHMMSASGSNRRTGGKHG